MCSIAVTTEVVGRMLWGQVTLMAPFQLLPFTSSLLLTQVVWGVHTVSASENFTAQPANHSKTYPLHFFFFNNLCFLCYFTGHISIHFLEKVVYFSFMMVFSCPALCISHSFPYGIISCAETLNSFSDTGALCTFCGCLS